ncbi:MAG: Immunoglobulin I-set domain-containing protein/Immunoglobulin I-set domain-containing protein [Verrucomicrobia bacterium]|nr:MAG: Immunoglobulin I-set domain-containing protein/Immunoglobulin I-set domain-containing protein [Verrucomicrobiota bacterium]
MLAVFIFVQTSLFAELLPTSVNVDTATGLMAGTLAINGGAAMNASATTANLAFMVRPPNPLLTSEMSVQTIAGQPFSYLLTATNAPSRFWAEGLPAGLRIDSASGLISGVVAGTVAASANIDYPVHVAAANDTGVTTGTLLLTVKPALPVIDSPLVVSGTVGTVFTYTISASGSPSFFASGLPAGVSFDFNKVISGTLQAVGTTTFTVGARNASGATSATVAVKVEPATLNLGTIDMGTLSAGSPLATRRFSSTFSDSMTSPVSLVTWAFAKLSVVPSWIQLSPNGTLSVLVPAEAPTGVTTIAVAGLYPDGTRVFANLQLKVQGMSRLSDGFALKWGILSRGAFTPLSSGTKVAPGEDVELSLETAVSGLSYQWRRDGMPILGCTNATLGLKVSGINEIGLYDVVVGNALGTAKSAGLAVASNVEPASLKGSLSNLVLMEGTTLRWSGFTADGGSLNYSWTRSAGAFPASAGVSTSAATLTMGPVIAADSGTYKVTASNSFSSVASSAILTVLKAARIMSSPANFGPINPGESANFSVDATGGDERVAGGGLRYQWYLRAPLGTVGAGTETPIAGANSSKFTFVGAGSADHGSRVFARVTQRDPATGAILETKNSTDATLLVRQPVELLDGGWVTMIPASGIVDLGGLVALSVSATGSDLFYQWRKDGVAVPGGTAATLRLSAAETSGGIYDVVVKNAINDACSSAATLKVKLPVVIVTQPVAKVVNLGSAARFRVEVKGAAPFNYQWRRDGVPLTDGVVQGGTAVLSGARTELLTISGVQNDSQGDYDVVVSNGIGMPATSDAVGLEASDSVRIQSNPADLTVAAGNSASFSIAASGKSLSYQWRRNGVAIVGARQPQLRLAVTSTADSGDYDVLVSSGALSVATQTARLEVLPKLAIITQPVGSTTVVPGRIGSATYILNVGATSGGTNLYEWFSMGASGSLQRLQSGPSSSFAAVATDVPTVYTVRVSGSREVNTDVGPVLLDLGGCVSAPVTVSLMEPASITKQPDNLVEGAGTSGVMEVVARAGGNVTYQWERERSGRWSSIVGAVTPRLTFSELLPSDSGLYRVIVSNERNSQTSNEALLKVLDADVIKVQPVAQAVNPGDTAVFSVVAVGKNLSYQWLKSGVPILGGTGATLRVSDAGASQVGLYEVKVSHAYGVSVSVSARLSLNEKVQILSEPSAPPLVERGNTTLVVKAMGTGPLNYQWRKNGVLIVNSPALTADKETLTITNASSSESGLYDVIVSNVVGSVSSKPARVDVLTGVVIKEVRAFVTTQASSPTPDLSRLQRGSGVLLTVVASGSPRVGEGKLLYQWRKDGVNLVDMNGVLSGAQSDTLLIASADPGSALTSGSSGKYDVVVTNDVNSVTSLGATLAVLSPPVILKQPLAQSVNKGDSVLLSVMAKGNGPFSYKWTQRLISNGTAETIGTLLTGKTSAELSLVNVQVPAVYNVKVTNPYGFETSLGATVDIIAPLSIDEDFTAATATAAAAAPSGTAVAPNVLQKKLGETGCIVFETAIPSQPGIEIKFQWRKNGVALDSLSSRISGGTSHVLCIRDLEEADAATYDLVISRLSGGAEKSRFVSRPTVLSIPPPPTISGFSNTFARHGERVLFAPTVMSVANPGSVTFQWYKDSSTHALQSDGLYTIGSGGASLSIGSASAITAGIYRLVVTDANGPRMAQANLNVSSPLTVIEGFKPTIQEVLRKSVSLGVKVISSADAGVVRYQWRFNGEPIRDAIADNLDLVSLNLAQAGAYDVVVSNDHERVVSGKCQIIVQDAWKITAQPAASITVNPGEALSLAVGLNRENVPEGYSPLSYQWIKGTGRSAQFVNGNASATAKVLTLNSMRASDAGVYFVIVTTPLGWITSMPSKVQVNLPLEIISQPATLPAVRPGEAARFRVKVKGTGPFNYQWRHNGVDIPGARGEELTLRSVSNFDAGTYNVFVGNNSLGGVLSNAATLAVLKPVSIVEEPKDVRVAAGGTASLSVKISGDGTCRYQWRRNGLTLAGCTSPTLSLAGLGTGDGGWYDVDVSNVDGNGMVISHAYSRKAQLQVFEAPVIVLAPMDQKVETSNLFNFNRSAVFRVVASGTAPLQYSWTRISGGTLTGGTLVGAVTTVLPNITDSLVIMNAGTSDLGEYTVHVSGPMGGSVSASAKLEEAGGKSKDVFTSQPCSLIGVETRPIRLTATVKNGFSILGWQRTVERLNPVTKVMELVSEELLNGGSLDLGGGSPSVLDTGFYRAIAISGSVSLAGGSLVSGTWGSAASAEASAKYFGVPFSVYVNPADPLYSPGFRDADNRPVWDRLELSQAMVAGEGGAARFQLFPTGQGLSFEWRKTVVVNGVTIADRALIAGENKPFLTLRNLKLEDGSVSITTGSLTADTRVTYTGVVLIHTGTLSVDGTFSQDAAAPVKVSSVPFNLMVQPLPRMSGPDSAPLSLLPVGAVTRVRGDTLELHGSGTYSGDTVFQWYFRQKGSLDWVPMPGASSPLYYSASGVGEEDEGDYRLEATNAVGRVSGDLFSVTVKDPLRIDLVLSQFEVDPGASVTMRVIASGSMKTGGSYGLWKQSKTTGVWSLIKTQSTDIFTFNSVKKTDEAHYRVRAYGEVNGPLESFPIKLAVRDVVAFASGTRLTTTSLGAGDSLLLKVCATGYSPVFKWYKKNGADWMPTELSSGASLKIDNSVPGVSTLSLLGGTPADAGSYGVVVMNNFSQVDGRGAHTSAVAAGLSLSPREIGRITVNNRPIAEPSSSTVVNLNEGASLSITMTVSDIPGSTVRYQWRKDGVMLPDTGKLLALPNTAVSLIRSAVTAADEGRYDLLVSNAYGLSLSAGVQVTINRAPQIAADGQPTDVITSEGGTATYRVQATGAGWLHYEWTQFKSGLASEVVGLDQPILTLKGLTHEDDGYFYQVTVMSDSGATVKSRPAQLRVSLPTDVQFTTQPHAGDSSVTRLNVAPTSMSTTCLKAIVSDMSQATSLNCQWRRNGVVVKTERLVRASFGAAYTSIYELATVTNDTDGVYDLLVDNGAAFACSQAFTVVVDPKIESLLIPRSVNLGDGVTLEVKMRNASSDYTYQWMSGSSPLVSSSSASTDIVSGGNTSVMTIREVSAASEGDYYVVVSKGTARLASGTVHMSVAAPVSIETEPTQSSSLQTGGELNLSVGAYGGGNLSYQWFKDGTALVDSDTSLVGWGASEVSGATTGRLRIGRVQSKDSGVYQVRVANASGSKMSKIAKVNVLEPLGVEIEALSLENKAQRTLKLGEGVNFVAKVTGSGVISLQWNHLVGGVYQSIKGATDEQYRINPATAADAGRYTITAKNSATGEEVTSAPVDLVVKHVPVIVVHPVSAAVITSGISAVAAVFAVVARSDSWLPLTYQWYRNGTAVSGATSSVLRLGDVRGSASCEYKVRVTNSEGFVETSAKSTVLAGGTVPKTSNAGATGTAFMPAGWWVYWTKASNGSKTLTGYWVLERILTKDERGNVTAVTPGSALWILRSMDSSHLVRVLKTDKWSSEFVTTQDVSVSERSEFSAVAYHSSHHTSFTMCGRVELGGDAALYGAPELMAGNYGLFGDDSAIEDFETDLSWDAEQTMLLGAMDRLSDVESALQTNLIFETVNINGE